MSDLLQTTGKINPTYSYREFSENNAIVVYYLYRCAMTAGNHYGLTTSTSINTSGATAEGYQTLESSSMPKTFLMEEFKIPRTVEGVAIFSGYVGKDTSAVDTSFNFKVQKSDGTTDTDISSAISSDYNNASRYISVRIPITKTKLKKGEYLQLVVNKSGADTFHLGINPAGGTDDVIATITDTQSFITFSYKLF